MTARVPEDRRCQAAVNGGWNFFPCSNRAKIGTCLTFWPDPQHLHPSRPAMLEQPIQLCGVHWNVFTKGYWLRRYTPPEARL